ncbi:hypothetical protein EVAR_64189_1 [Eumeta japonica]|uniref:Uncharacterized protein n=1 Tax=Eumeta variegata TaxID=151549 RepID=A0A4C1ZHI0_EUMVA|nr:hypothetical protein EVAR_64189_1 [Eumeta japonica]
MANLVTAQKWAGLPLKYHTLAEYGREIDLLFVSSSESSGGLLLSPPPSFQSSPLDPVFSQEASNAVLTPLRLRMSMDAAVHADASLTQVGERQMSHAAERGGRLCLFVARSALSLALQALNGTPQSEVTPHESCFSCVQTAPLNYKTLSRQKLKVSWHTRLKRCSFRYI